MESKRLQTAKKYIGHFANLDIETLESVLAKDYVHQFAPASMSPPGPFDRQGKLDHINRLRNILAGFPVTAKEYIESESSNRVTVWATSQTVFHEHVKDDGIAAEEWNYRGEYIFIFTMDETGERIIRTIEFLDSKHTVDKLLKLSERARENRERRLASKTN